MTPEGFAEHLRGELEAAVLPALRGTLQDVEQDIRKRLPAVRQLTRKALRRRIRKRSGGYLGTIRLAFGKQYRSRGTTTERVFLKAWEAVRPTVRRRLQTRLNDNLKE